MKGLVVKYEFDIETIREMIQQIFNEGEVEVVVRPTSIKARFYNGNAFEITIYNLSNCISANCRRKYTSVKPDWEHRCKIDSNIEGILECIRTQLIKLNDKFLR